MSDELWPFGQPEDVQFGDPELLSADSEQDLHEDLLEAWRLDCEEYQAYLRWKYDGDPDELLSFEDSGAVLDALIGIWTPPEDGSRAWTPLEQAALESMQRGISESTLAAAEAMPKTAGEFQQIGKALDLLTDSQVNDQEFLARAGLLEARNRFIECKRALKI